MNPSTFIRLALVVGLAVAALPNDALSQKRQRERITHQEIAASPQREMDLYQVIRNLRPFYLEAPRGVRTLGGSATVLPVVVVDGKRDTGIDALRDIRAMDVEEVRYLDPAKSESEYGPRANGGAVLVRLRKATKDS